MGGRPLSPIFCGTRRSFPNRSAFDDFDVFEQLDSIARDVFATHRDGLGRMFGQFRIGRLVLSNKQVHGSISGFDPHRQTAGNARARTVRMLLPAGRVIHVAGQIQHLPGNRYLRPAGRSSFLCSQPRRSQGQPEPKNRNPQRFSHDM